MQLVQTTATGVLVLLAALWALVWLSGWWRGHIRDRMGPGMERTAKRLRGQVCPIWSGWAVVVGGRRVVVWRGTIWGPRTTTGIRPNASTVDGLHQVDTLG